MQSLIIHGSLERKEEEEEEEEEEGEKSLEDRGDWNGWRMSISAPRGGEEKRNETQVFCTV